MSADETVAWAVGTAGRAAEVAVRVLDPSGDAGRAQWGGAVWALGRRDPALAKAQAPKAGADARALSAAAFPAVAHAALAIQPGGSEFGKRLRLTWAVARGRI